MIWIMAQRGDQGARAWVTGDALPWLEAIGFVGVGETDLREAIGESD